jgi:glycine oxidase
MIEVVVIGGGVAGAAAALALAERGAAVNLIEAERPGSAATGASAGMLAPQYESAGAGPLYDVLVSARAAYPDFCDRIEALTGEGISPRWEGMLVANMDEAEHAAAAAMLSWQHAGGQRGEVLDVGRALALQPGIAEDVHSWLWLPDEGQVDAQRLAVLLGNALAAAGVRLLAGRRAAAVIIERGVAAGVTLEDGRTLGADAVIVAAGAWSARLQGLPHPPAVRPVRGHIVRFPAGAAPLHRLVASHAARYLVPRDDGTILAGSTMDETGFDRSIDERALGIVQDAAGRLAPGLSGVRPVEHWADLRPISEDGLPIIGPDPDAHGLYYATGYGRNGILLGPLAGEAVAGMLLGTSVSDAWRHFRPGRASGTGPERPSGDRPLRSREDQ